jgi:hypothetical protein
MFILDSPGNQTQTNVLQSSGVVPGTTPNTINSQFTFSNVATASGAIAAGVLVNTSGTVTATPTTTGTFQISQNSTWNEGFYRRQQLTDSGKVAYLRIPLSRLFGFCQLDRVLYGQQVVMRLYPAPAGRQAFHALEDITGAAVGDADILIKGIDLILACQKPSLAVQAKLSEQLIAGTSSELVWEYADTYQFTANAGATSLNQVITSVSEKINYIVMTFQPSTYQTSQLYPSASSWQPCIGSSAANPSAVSPYTNLTFTQAYLQINAQFIPAVFYQTLQGDPARLYQEYLDVSNRLDPTSGLSPALSFQDFWDPYVGANAWVSITNGGLTKAYAGVGGYFMMVFDTRHMSMDAASSNQPSQVIFNASLQGVGLAQTTTVFCTIFSERVGVVQAANRSILLSRK